MKKICSKYVMWYNKKYKRTGHLFQDRFKSEPVESDEYLLTVVRYIHQNLLTAKIGNEIDEFKVFKLSGVCK
jgi:putative transposase